MTCSLNIICVLYNKRINEIKSLNNFLSIKKNNNVNIIILDNSIEEYTKINEEKARGIYNNDINYINNHANIGLSKSYNKGLNTIMDGNFWVMLSDDDTFFSMKYLSDLINTITSEPSEMVISGIIKNNGKYFSPLKKHSALISEKDFIKEAGVYKNIYCINSGLCINNIVFDKIGLYDESYFLDMIDFWFMNKLIEYNINNIRIIDGEISQDFSGSKLIDYKNMEKRFLIFSKDFSHYCKDFDKSKFFEYIIIIKRYIKIKIIKIINYTNLAMNKFSRLIGKEKQV